MSDEDLIGPEGQKKLLEVARKSIEAAANGRPLPEVELQDPELQACCGAFVTLTAAGRLRGCLGCFASDEPIYLLVNSMAASSLTDDPRFGGDRIPADQLDDVRIEISVLSPMRRISDPLNEVKKGKHGIYIKRGSRSGTYLPQVAVEHNMSVEDFLSSCCSHKAGLAPDAWKNADTEVYVYTALVFHEE